MSLTVKQSIEANVTLESLISSDKDNKFVFPSSARIGFAGMLRKTRPILSDYQSEHSILVKRLGEEIDKEKGIWKVKAENTAEFNKENEAMLNEETDVVLKPISVSELGENQIPIDLLATLIDVGVIKE